MISRLQNKEIVIQAKEQAKGDVTLQCMSFEEANVTTERATNNIGLKASQLQMLNP